MLMKQVKISGYNRSLELTIEKLIYGGDGLARLPADEKGRGKAAFVPFTLTGERVEAAVREEKPGFVRAQLSRIVQASAERIDARCPYFQRCGGCHYQHAGHSPQLKIKADILKENLRRVAKMEWISELKVHASPPWNYRNRTRLQIRGGADFLLGYLKSGSNEVVGVEECPISSPLLNRAIAALWKLGREGKIAAEIREIELFADHDDQRLKLELYGDPRDRKSRIHAGEVLMEALRPALPEVVSAHVFVQTAGADRGGALSVAHEPDWSWGEDFSYRTKARPLRVSGGSFFQVNRFLVDELVETVTRGRSGDVALDLYAGVGLFTAALGQSFRHIVAVESSQSSVRDLQYNSPENVKVVRSTVDEYLEAKSGKIRLDLVVADPPRAGLGDRVVRGLVKLGAARLIYVSCDPATLARDLGSLVAGGYRVEQMHLMDLFPQTYHIETVVELVR
ncbi:MAG: 23S rRNA (uracil(1939)-C(5))-methyltransferase RlmD [Acidobacteria bacterium]|nr:MAG: 23S rRNA (uracil(1939)-C(5))-methyltransferase RlmD [Acidobacteriota bacterium]